MTLEGVGLDGLDSLSDGLEAVKPISHTNLPCFGLARRGKGGIFDTTGDSWKNGVTPEQVDDDDDDVGAPVDWASFVTTDI